MLFITYQVSAILIDLYFLILNGHWICKLKYNLNILGLNILIDFQYRVEFLKFLLIKKIKIFENFLINITTLIKLAIHFFLSNSGN